MSSDDVSFISPHLPDEIWRRFGQYAQKYRYSVERRGEIAAVARQAMTVATWNRNIWIFAAPVAQGSEVHLIMTTWQLINWGTGKRILESLKSTLTYYQRTG